MRHGLVRTQRRTGPRPSACASLECESCADGEAQAAAAAVAAAPVGEPNAAAASAATETPKEQAEARKKLEKVLKGMKDG